MIRVGGGAFFPPFFWTVRVTWYVGKFVYILRRDAMLREEGQLDLYF
jgi:hypothetical protein